MSEHLQGKVVVITGAGSGFGRLVAERCADRGAKVVGADVDQTTLAQTFDALAEDGHEVRAVPTDVTDLAQVQALARAAVEAFGGIDVMVNNAGVMPLAFYADHEVAAAGWDRCIDVNLKGVLHGISAVYDQMVEQGRGHVVNVSSIYSNFPTAGAGVYAATKSAVNVLSEALRVEAQGKIKVSVVRPTGVPKTGLGGSVVNGAAVVGIFGQNAPTAIEGLMAYLGDQLEPEQTDPDSPRLWSLEPEHIADQVVYVMDQPWGVSISDITVRATGEEYVL
jgi:NADP-dependent 3-hydroxy acid dehydrogenase YdfG